MFYKSDKKMIKDAGVIGGLTVVSRILGFIRDAIVAMFLGAGLHSDAFFTAFRIPDLFRKFFSDGALSISFIPVFTQIQTDKGLEDAFDMARSAMLLISVIGVIFILIFTLLTEFFLVMPDITIRLSNIMMPYVVSICLLSVCMGMLNSMEHFAAPAAAPVLLNLTIICFVVIFSPFSDHPSVIMAWGVTAGGTLQLAIQVPFILKKGFRFKKRVLLFHPDSIRAFKMMLPTVIGIAPLQVNMLVATFIASSMTSVFAQGSVSYLYYADRLVQFPLGLFTFSVSTSIFPALSREVACHDMKRVSDIFARGIRLVLFMMIPSMAGLAVLSEPIVRLLFHHGAFGLNDVHATAKVLIYLCTGMWIFSVGRLFVSLFYALSNVRTPLIGGVISMISNILLSFILMKNMGIYGLALSISCASVLNFSFLLKSLLSMKFIFPWREVVATACRSLCFSAIMYVVVYVVSNCFFSEVAANKTILLINVIVCVFTGSLVYVGLGFFFKAPELMFLNKEENK